MNLRILKKKSKRGAARLIRHAGYKPGDFTPADGGRDAVYATRHCWPRHQIEDGRFVVPLPGTPMVWSPCETECGTEWDSDTAWRMWQEFALWTPGLGRDRDREELIAQMEASDA